jgi:hypothetical protein
MGAEKRRIHNTDGEDRKRDAVRAAPGCPFISIDTISFTTMKRK